MSKYCVVLTTFGTEEDAKRIINIVFECKLAACIQTIDIGSHYIWDGKTCHDKEVLVLFKTSWNLYEQLENTIKENHPYDTPEIIAIDIENGFHGYLNWIDSVTQ